MIEAALFALTVVIGAVLALVASMARDVNSIRTDMRRLRELAEDGHG